MRFPLPNAVQGDNPDVFLTISYQMPVWTQALVPELQIDEFLYLLFHHVKVFRIVQYENPVA